MPSSSASAHAQAAREGFRARKSLGMTTLAVPESTDAEYTLAENGTFVEGDLSVTAHGLVINNAGESDRAGAQLAATEAAAAASRSVGQGAFATLNLDALSVQGTIGAGSSGVVQRVVYGKQTYALKLIQVEMAQQARKQLCTELRTLSGRCTQTSSCSTTPLPTRAACRSSWSIWTQEACSTFSSRRSAYPSTT